MKIDGTCHCGAIAYEAEINPQEVYLSATAPTARR